MGSQLLILNCQGAYYYLSNPPFKRKNLQQVTFWRGYCAELSASKQKYGKYFISSATCKQWIDFVNEEREETSVNGTLWNHVETVDISNGQNYMQNEASTVQQSNMAAHSTINHSVNNFLE